MYDFARPVQVSYALLISLDCVFQKHGLLAELHSITCLVVQLSYETHALLVSPPLNQILGPGQHCARYLALHFILPLLPAVIIELLAVCVVVLIIIAGLLLVLLQEFVNVVGDPAVDPRKRDHLLTLLLQAVLLREIGVFEFEQFLALIVDFGGTAETKSHLMINKVH